VLELWTIDAQLAPTTSSVGWNPRAGAWRVWCITIELE